MRKKSPQSRKPAAPSPDTSTYEQSQGAPGPRVAPNRPNARMPHERDESASATGDRLEEKLVPSDREITQAREDVEKGLVDTDRRGVPSDIPKPE